MRRAYIVCMYTCGARLPYPEEKLNFPSILHVQPSPLNCPSEEQEVQKNIRRTRVRVAAKRKRPRPAHPTTKNTQTIMMPEKPT